MIGQAEETSLSPKLDVKENDECVTGLMASLAEQRARAEREDRRWRGRTVTGFKRPVNRRRYLRMKDGGGGGGGGGRGLGA